jgi:hypothetical protein
LVWSIDLVGDLVTDVRDQIQSDIGKVVTSGAILALSAPAYALDSLIYAFSEVVDPLTVPIPPYDATYAERPAVGWVLSASGFGPDFIWEVEDIDVEWRFSFVETLEVDYDSWSFSYAAATETVESGWSFA